MKSWTRVGNIYAYNNLNFYYICKQPNKADELFFWILLYFKIFQNLGIFQHRNDTSILKILFWIPCRQTYNIIVYFSEAQIDAVLASAQTVGQGFDEVRILCLMVFISLQF